MLMPKKDRMKIYEYLFKEGVCVAKKDVHLKSHPDLEGVRNLYVIKACQSLTSKGYVKEQFAWRHYYWYLTNEGIEYLREFLNLPPEIVPATLRRQTRATDIRTAGAPRGPSSGPRAGDDDRAAYRKVPDGAPDKVADAGAGAMDFRGGFGRGKPF